MATYITTQDFVNIGNYRSDADNNMNLLDRRGATAILIYSSDESMEHKRVIGVNFKFRYNIDDANNIDFDDYMYIILVSRLIDCGDFRNLPFNEALEEILKICLDNHITPNMLLDNSELYIPNTLSDFTI